MRTVSGSTASSLWRVIFTFAISLVLALAVQISVTDDADAIIFAIRQKKSSVVSFFRFFFDVAAIGCLWWLDSIHTVWLVAYVRTYVVRIC